MVDRYDVAWAAGFYEGEGNISMYKGKRGWNHRLEVVQVNREPLEKLQSLYGGTIRHKQHRTGKPYHVWRLMSYGEMFRFIVDITPWLSDKRMAQVWNVMQAWTDRRELAR